MTPPAVAVVLAGGDSARMGTAKAAIAWEGGTLLARAVAALRPAVGRVVVVRAHGQELTPPGDGVVVVEDARPGRGPLEGMLAGLRALRPGEVAFVCAVDMPLLEAPFARAVLDALRPGRRRGGAASGRRAPSARGGLPGGGRRARRGPPRRRPSPGGSAARAHLAWPGSTPPASPDGPRIARERQHPRRPGGGALSSSARRPPARPPRRPPGGDERERVGAGQRRDRVGALMRHRDQGPPPLVAAHELGALGVARDGDREGRAAPPVLGGADQRAAQQVQSRRRPRPGCPTARARPDRPRRPSQVGRIGVASTPRITSSTPSSARAARTWSWAPTEMPPQVTTSVGAAVRASRRASRWWPRGRRRRSRRPRSRPRRPRAGRRRRGGSSRGPRAGPGRGARAAPARRRSRAPPRAGGAGTARAPGPRRRWRRPRGAPPGGRRAAARAPARMSSPWRRTSRHGATASCTVTLPSPAVVISRRATASAPSGRVAPGRDGDGLARAERPAEGRPRRALADGAQLAGRVGRAHGPAVHGGDLGRGQVAHGHDVGGEHPAGGLGHVHQLDLRDGAPASARSRAPSPRVTSCSPPMGGSSHERPGRTPERARRARRRPPHAGATAWPARSRWRCASPARTARPRPSP